MKEVILKSNITINFSPKYHCMFGLFHKTGLLFAIYGTYMVSKKSTEPGVAESVSSHKYRILSSVWGIDYSRPQ